MDGNKHLQPTSISIIDFSLPEAEIIPALKKACVDIGFFYLVNHGVQRKLMDEVFLQSQKFFELPVLEKLKSNMNEKGRGYTAYMAEVLDPKNNKRGDTKEGYYIGQEIPPDDPRSTKLFHGPNQWPDENILPEWREVMSRYWRCMRLLALQMVPLFALALDLPSNWFNSRNMFHDPIATLRLLHYPGEKSSPEDGVFGAGAHSDYGFITLLATDNVPGLQVCREKDVVPRVWEDVPALPGAFIVNLGDCLERWTNGKFKSTLHRVLNPGTERYSIPYFFEPDVDCVVECVSTCCSEENPPKYGPITFGEYLLSRYRETHDSFTGGK